MLGLKKETSSHDVGFLAIIQYRDTITQQDKRHSYGVSLGADGGPLLYANWNDLCRSKEKQNIDGRLPWQYGFERSLVMSQHD